jgi:hypothetical protein
MKGIIALLAVLLALGVMFFFYASPTSEPAEMTKSEIAQIEAEVREAMEVGIDGWRELDLEKAMAPFHPTATSWALPETPRPYAEIRQWAADWIENLEAWEGNVIDMKVRVLGRDAAAFQMLYGCTITPKEGPIMHHPGNAVWTGVIERTANGWKTTLGGLSYGPYEEIERG